MKIEKRRMLVPVHLPTVTFAIVFAMAVAIDFVLAVALEAADTPTAGKHSKRHQTSTINLSHDLGHNII